MPMSVAFGRGPAAWVDAAGGASAAPADVVVLGARDPEEAARHRRPARGRRWLTSRSSAPASCALTAFAPRARGRARRLGSRDGRRFWIHLDVDVLDERAMPATDYLMPDGLRLGRARRRCWCPLGASPGLAGLSLGCLNPEKDPDGAYTERTCALLAGALAAP